MSSSSAADEIKRSSSSKSSSDNDSKLSKLGIKGFKGNKAQKQAYLKAKTCSPDFECPKDEYCDTRYNRCVDKRVADSDFRKDQGLKKINVGGVSVLAVPDEAKRLVKLEKFTEDKERLVKGKYRTLKEYRTAYDDKKRCSEDEDYKCEDGRVCDTRWNLCVPEEIGKEQGLSTLNYKGSMIIGVKDEIERLKKNLEKPSKKSTSSSKKSSSNASSDDIPITPRKPEKPKSKPSLETKLNAYDCSKSSDREILKKRVKDLIDYLETVGKISPNKLPQNPDAVLEYYCASKAGKTCDLEGNYCPEEGDVCDFEMGLCVPQKPTYGIMKKEKEGYIGSAKKFDGKPTFFIGKRNLDKTGELNKLPKPKAKEKAKAKEKEKAKVAPRDGIAPKSSGREKKVEEPVLPSSSESEEESSKLSKPTPLKAPPTPITQSGIGKLLNNLRKRKATPEELASLDDAQQQILKCFGLA
jgi:hypothetical protein